MTQYKPYFILGMAKCGTTSLFEYINHHPRVIRPAQKEIRYCNKTAKEDLSLKTYTTLLAPNAPYQSKDVIGEASGYGHKPTSLEKLHSLFPEAKLFLLLRHPADRIWSWHMHRLRGSGRWEPLSPQRYENYCSRTLFHDDDNVENILNLFSRKQLMVIKSEDLFYNPQNVMRRVFRHIGIRPVKVNAKAYNQSRFSKKKNAGMPDKFKKRIAEDFRDRTTRLYSLIGRDLHWFD